MHLSRIFLIRPDTRSSLQTINILMYIVERFSRNDLRECED